MLRCTSLSRADVSGASRGSGNSTCRVGLGERAVIGEQAVRAGSVLASAITCCRARRRSALRTDASDGLDRAAGPRRAVVSTGASPPPSRAAPPVGGSGREFRRARRTRSITSLAVGPRPHSAPSPESETRSFPSADLRQTPTVVLRAGRHCRGTRTSLKNTSLKLVGTGHLHERSHLDPGARM